MDVYSTSEIAIDRLVVCDCHDNTIIDIWIIMCTLYGVDLDAVSCSSSSTMYFITLCIVCTLRKEVKWV